MEGGSAPRSSRKTMQRIANMFMGFVDTGTYTLVDSVTGSW